MDFSTTLFRCSSLGHLMTDPRNKKDKDAGNLSETAKTHLVDVYVSRKYGRRTEVQTRYMNKGLMVEEDSVTLYSRLKKRFYKKNETSLRNDFIMGTPDLYEGPDIYHAVRIPELKSSWDIFTFFRVHTKEVNADYWWQCQGYMDLTGAPVANLAYCLIDTPLTLIEDEKRKLMWKMGAASSENEDYKQACEELEKNMTYADIPMSERLIEFEIQRDQEAIDGMHQRVEKARIFLNELEQSLHPSVLLATGDPEVNATIIEKA